MMKKTLLSASMTLAFCIGSPALGKTTATLPLDEIRNFVDVYNTIRREYVEEKDGKTLIEYAIKGMLNGLDPHSVYLKKDEIEDFKDAASGNYQGFGIQLEMLGGNLIIIAPIAGGPADKAGIKAGDIIAKIDDTVINNMSMADVSKLLKSKDTVTLTITRDGEKAKKFTLKKTTVILPSVIDKIIDADYGYIRIGQFQEDTSEQFERSLKKLIGEEIKGLVLDLRNNPGGLLHVATDIADDFLDAGLIVSTKKENTGTEDKIHATKETLAPDLPLVVLINKGSASAAELLAGALKDHRRCVVVGQPSFGKGSVQNIVPLSDGSAIKITTARYYTPNGTSIQAKGIIPNIILSQLQVDNKDIDLLSYTEADISGHLENIKKSSDKDNDKDDKDKTLVSLDLAKKDLQLFEALNVLKVLNLKR
ncbi:MAG: peptidase S41 [Gammaproteobacteria bacterium]|nr:MAG: peptidase S41 [Gammaproteobacteria bacterium]